MTLLHKVLSHTVRLYPDKVALIEGDVRLTYREADVRIARLAQGLLDSGAQQGARVGLMALNSHRYFESYYATERAGTVVVPLNYRLSPGELAYCLNDAEATHLLLGAEFLPLYEQFKDQLQTVKQVIVMGGDGQHGHIDYEKLVASSKELQEPARAWDEDDMMQLYYTSGTTGKPKGVMLSQRNVVSNAYHVVMNTGFTEADVWLHAAPMFHLADAWSCFAVTLMGGGHVFVREFVPAQVLQTMQDERITTTILVPTMINFLVNTPNVRDYDTSALRVMLYGASPMPVDRLRAAIDVFGPVLYQGYGMTETAPLLTVLHAKDHITDGPEEKVRRLSSCGREIPGVEVRVVDAAGNEVGPGQIGEIVARGPNVMLGYWKLPEATAEAIVDGWMHTGDLATVDHENFIFIVDRKKDMIITGGENVFSTEVEDILYRHPAVLEAAVIGVPDEKWGEAVKAIVVLRPDQTATEEEVIEFCRANIAHYKSPRSVDFAESLPKTGSGKIQKSEIRKRYWEGFERKVN